MRITLIGCGATGSVAAAHLAKVSEVEGLVLTDAVPGRAERLAHAVGRKARAVRFAGGDLGPLVRGSHLAINAAHASLDLALMDACLDEGAHFMDLSSLPSKQFPYDVRFRKAGLTAFLGGGEDPGLGNVLARYGADRLDAVEAIRIRDGDTVSSEATPLPVVWSPETFLAEVFTDALYFEDGKIVTVPPWSGREVYPFPAPVGPQPVYWMEHEEPETLPRFIGKGVRYVDLKLAVDDRVRDLLETLHRLGLLSGERVEGVAPRKLLLSLLPGPRDLIGKVEGHGMIAVEVAGTQDGGHVTHRLWASLSHREAARTHGATATAYMVGTGAAIFATQFARGQVRQAGVIAAEALDPEETVRLMATYGLPVTHEVLTETSLS